MIGRERRIEADVGGRVEQPHAVGADHAHAVIADAFDQLALQRPAAFTGFCKSRGNHHERFHAGRRAVVDDGENGRRRHGDHGQVGPAGRSRADR